MRGPGSVRWETPVILPIAGLTLGSAVGVLINAVNGGVSSEYFVAVLGAGPGDLHNLIFLHGAAEGGLLGLLFGVTLAIAAAASGRLRVPLQMALVTLALAVAVDVACAVGGAVVGVAWAVVSPASFHAAVPLAAGIAGADLARFAWVGGSIDGGYLGAAIAAVVGCVQLHYRWRSTVRRAAIGGQFAVLPVRR